MEEMMQPNHTLSAQEYLRDEAANKLEAVKGAKLELAVFLARLKRLRDEGDLDISPPAFLAMELAMEQTLDDEFEEPWRHYREIGGDVTTPVHIPSCASLMKPRSTFTPLSANHRASVAVAIAVNENREASFSLFDEIKAYARGHENLRRKEIL